MGKISEALKKKNREADIVSAEPTGQQQQSGAAAVETHEFPTAKKPAYLHSVSAELLMKGVDQSLVTALKPQSFESEQFRMLRSNLLFPVNGKSPRTIMVTSAVPGEGKSFIASNLAISIAYYVDNYVLLIDCDMRSPSIHKLFGVSSEALDVYPPGLSEYLSQNASLSPMLIKTTIDKLTVLPGGNPPPNPSELLSSKRMIELLQETKTKFSDRYIIIDSPPPILTSDISVIARHVDGIVLVVRYGNTSRMLVNDLVQSLGKDKILGVVFNQSEMIGLFNRQSATYGKYGKYRKYRQYGK